MHQSVCGRRYDRGRVVVYDLFKRECTLLRRQDKPNELTFQRVLLPLGRSVNDCHSVRSKPRPGSGLYIKFGHIARLKSVHIFVNLAVLIIVNSCLAWHLIIEEIPRELVPVAIPNALIVGQQRVANGIRGPRPTQIRMEQIEARVDHSHDNVCVAARDCPRLGHVHVMIHLQRAHFARFADQTRLALQRQM